MTNNCYISERAIIGDNVILGNNVTIYGNSQISDNCLIGDNVTIGFPSIQEMDSLKSIEKDNHLTIDTLSSQPTCIGKGAKILSNSVIYSGVRIGDSTIIFEHTRIGAGTIIGRDSKIRYGAQIYTDVLIGDKCIIAGFCCSRARIGSNSSMCGNLIHKYNKGWISGLKEPPPIIDEYVIVGYNATLIGNIKISKYVYIAAGAIVTKDVQSNSIVVGCRVYGTQEWIGSLNLNSIFKLNGNEENE